MRTRSENRLTTKINKNMSTKSKFYLSNYTDGCFQYQYQSHGKEVMVNVIVEYRDLMIDDKSIGLTEDDLLECEDIDDCTLAIARHIIKDNDGEVLTRFIDEYGDTLTRIGYVKRMNKNLEFINNEGEGWYLTLCADGGCDVLQFNFSEVAEDDIHDVMSMFEAEDSGGLIGYAWSSKSMQTSEILPIYGDDEAERLSFEITDENGDIVDEGEVRISERNIRYYDDCQPECITGESKHPKYLLIYSDVMKRTCSGFNVPKGFNIGEVHFVGEYPVEPDRLIIDDFGDYTTNMFSFRYQGKKYSCDDYSDCGGIGDFHFYLYERNDENSKYYVIKEF